MGVDWVELSSCSQLGSLTEKELYRARPGLGLQRSLHCGLCVGKTETAGSWNSWSSSTLCFSLFFSLWNLQILFPPGGIGVARLLKEWLKAPRAGIPRRLQRLHPLYELASEVTSCHFCLTLMSWGSPGSGTGIGSASWWEVARLWKSMKDGKFCCGYFWKIQFATVT